MKFRKNASGFSLAMIVAVVGVIAAVGLVGFNVYSRNQDSKQAPVASQGSNATSDPEAPDIKSTEDLTTAEKALDNTDIDNSSEATQLDSELSAF